MLSKKNILWFIGFNIGAILLFSLSSFHIINIIFRINYFNIEIKNDFSNVYFSCYLLALFVILFYFCKKYINLKFLSINTLIIFSLVSFLFISKKDSIDSYITEESYTLLDNYIKKFENNNKNIYETKEYKAYLEDKLTNNPNSLSKYKNTERPIKYKLEHIIPIEKSDYVSLMLIKSNQGLNINIKNKINDISSDKVVTLEEIKNFQEFVIDYSNEDYNQIASLMNSISINKY